MIKCTLRDKVYTVDYVTGRALRESDAAGKVLAQIVRIGDKVEKGEDVGEEGKRLSMPAAMDTLIKWFCLLFGNQFTPDEVLDNYPADSLMKDISFALMAVNKQTTEVLSEFPIPPAVRKRKA